MIRKQPTSNQDICRKYTWWCLTITFCFLSCQGVIAQRNWKPVESGTGFDLWGICFADSTRGTVVGDRGTILHTTDGGFTWVGQASGTTANLNSVAFTGPDTGIAVGVGVILYTTNGGWTWSRQFTDDPNELGDLQTVSLVDGKTGFIVGTAYPGGYTRGIVLRTTNGGTTWEPRDLQLDSGLLGGSFINATTGTVVGPKVIYRTTDAGEQWVRDTGDFYLNRVQFTDKDNGTASGLHVILRTRDGGEHWVAQDTGNTSWFLGLSFLNADSGIAVGSPHTLNTTTNGGVTWTRTHIANIVLNSRSTQQP